METPHHGTHLTGKEGEDFDLDLAASWTKNHREKHPDQPESHFFGKEILQKILAQDGCMGIRFYHSLNEEGKKHLIITGATADGKDQLNVGVKGAKGEKHGAIHTIGQEAMPCPGSPGCPTNDLTGGK